MRNVVVPLRNVNETVVTEVTSGAIKLITVIERINTERLKTDEH
jgi:hypothetical protein